jgi:prepilin-type N-terminal cleavage/methylation domain-containing protein
MKKAFNRNDGFTLVELIVAMAMAVIVTAAATSVLLLGLRVNRQTADTASQQITVRTLLTTVENIISEGNISDIEMSTESWCIWEKGTIGEDGQPVRKVLLSYFYDPDEKQGAVYVGDYRHLDDALEDTTATPVLTGLLSSYVEMYDGLFTIHVETKEGIFSSSVLCRSMATGVGEYEDTIDPGDIEDNREEFIKILKSQYRSRGQIIGADPNDPYQYFSEWYIQSDYDDEIPDNGWNAKTPWCACYVSWALVKVNAVPPMDHERWFANVDEFMAYFQTDGTWMKSKAHGGSVDPQPGDLIFFDWNKGENPQHVGVVLKVEDHMVYTIEGNSAGRVTIRSYTKGDPRIIGYGLIFAA